MKFLAILLLTMVPLVAQADMMALDAGFGNGTRPFYGFDYEFVKDWPYADISLTGNSSYIQPYLSFGIQGEHINVGFAQAITFSRTDGSAVYALGPEAGWQQNLSSLVYIKENNSLLYSGTFSFSASFGIGLNL